MSKRYDYGYVLVEERPLSKFEDAVNELLQDGWLPHGSFFKYGDYYYQPMLKHKK